MSGFLDNKKRVIDACLTREGRRQLSEGGLRIDGYSFTDECDFYSEDLDTGISDASVRVHLEASDVPQDIVTFDTNEAGNVQAFSNESGIQVTDGQIVEYVTDSNSTDSLSFLSGDEFLVQADELLQGSSRNLRNVMVLSTRDEIFDDGTFSVGNRNVEFAISNQKPLPRQASWVANVNSEPGLFSDDRLAHVANFKFLPPITGVEGDNVDRQDHASVAKFALGNYVPLASFTKVNDQDLLDEIASYEKNGFSRKIKFEPTSKFNNVIVQIFERKRDRLSKLKLVDRGIMRSSSGTLQHVFFVGKLFVDEHDVHTFVHVFTLIFS